MKKTLSIFAFILIAFSTSAQVSSVPSAEVKNQVEILKNADLGLTDVQLSRVTSVLMGEENNMIRTKKALEGNKSQLDIRMKEFKANKINNIKGTMSPQQAEKFDALKLADKF